MQQIERGIYYEDSYLGVTVGGLVFSHGTILIDAPLRAEEARSWRSALLNQRGGANRLLVNLDSHPDRTLGARAMDCTIIAHQKTAQVFRNRSTIFKGQTNESGATWETYNDAIGMRWAIPDITFTQRVSLFWGGPEIIIESHPGPTSGAVWVIIPTAHVLFAGDSLVADQPPFLANAELETWMEALDLLENSYSDFAIISGRGGPTNIGAVRAQRQFFRNVIKSLDRLAKHNAPTEAAEELVPGLISEFSFPAGLEETYSQRLRHGLSQYYARHYRSANNNDQSHLDDGEQ
ncbi:MAG TPA: MBL fold metallo-hydrolase [Anaerolineales bacterium]